MSDRVLVVGSKPTSLGDAVCVMAQAHGFEVMTAGVTGESLVLDLVLTSHDRMVEMLAGVQPRHIVCTVGMNIPQPQDRDLSDWYRWHFETNVTGPMRLLDAWTDAMASPEYLPQMSIRQMCHYVAISSNSARIPRTRSAAYCASKAALSMALRVQARQATGGNGGFIVYGYEPGLLSGTPMTVKTEEQFPHEVLHRMRGQYAEDGIPPRDMAQLIVSNLMQPGAALNGSLVQYDVGEL